MTNTSFDDDRSATAESVDGHSNQELLHELETLRREKKRYRLVFDARWMSVCSGCQMSCF